MREIRVSYGTCRVLPTVVSGQYIAGGYSRGKDSKRSRRKDGRIPTSSN